jgi:hypothetical protein
MKDISAGNGMDRRGFLGSAGAAALGALWLKDRVAAAQGPSTDVADRGSGIRITRLRGFRVGAKAYLKIETNRNVTGGERERTIWGFLPFLQERCVDIFQPDCGHTGGISQMRKIATLAEAFFVPLAPHCTMSELGLTASLHVAASIPLFLIHEAYLDGHLMPPGVARKNWDVDKDGFASLPQGPGLGVEVDESMFEKVNADPKRKFKWPTPTAQDGAVRDY